MKVRDARYHTARILRTRRCPRVIQNEAQRMKNPCISTQTKKQNAGCFAALSMTSLRVGVAPHFLYSVIFHFYLCFLLCL